MIERGRVRQRVQDGTSVEPLAMTSRLVDYRSFHGVQRIADAWPLYA